MVGIPIESCARGGYTWQPEKEKKVTMITEKALLIYKDLASHTHYIKTELWITQLAGNHLHNVSEAAIIACSIRFLNYW